MASTPPAPNWYLAEDAGKHVRQVVVLLPVRAEVPAQVDNLVCGDLSFVMGNWATTLLFMDSGKFRSSGPFVFAKATGVADMLRGQPVEVAFAFYHLRRGGVFQLFVQVQSPKVKAITGNSFGYLAERAWWPEEADYRELIDALVRQAVLEVCFVAQGAKGPCTGQFGFAVTLPEACLQALQAQWAELLAHHEQVARPDVQLALAQYNAENPMEESPILKRRTSWWRRWV